MPLNPDDFIITRKRKKYKFAHFAVADNCIEFDELQPGKLQKLAADRQVTIEVGAGSALFSLELARRHPGRFYVATDVKADRLQKAARIALEEGLGNVVFVRVHADRIDQLFPHGSVNEVWLTFSDPFPKKRHAKHRLTHPHFLSLYWNALRPDGVLRQKTDDHALFDWSLEQLVATGWHIKELPYDLHESKLLPDSKIMTTFETKFVSEGLPICYVASRR